jgi:hypothetical protein
MFVNSYPVDEILSYYIRASIMAFVRGSCALSQELFHHGAAYNMFMKGVDRANQYLAYYSLPRKTMKWTRKVALCLINCAIFNSYLVYKNLNPDSKLKYKAFMMNVAKDWAETEFRHRLGATGTVNSTYVSCGPPWATFGWFAETCPCKNCEE